MNRMPHVPLAITLLFGWISFSGACFAEKSTLTIGLGSYQQASSAFTQQWTANNSDLDGDRIVFSYLKPWTKTYSAGVSAGVMRGDTRRTNVISAGDASWVETEIFFIGPRIEYQRGLAPRFAVYGSGELDYYNFQTNFRYESPTANVDNDDNKHAFGAHIAAGGRYQFANAGSNEFGTLQTDFFVFGEIGYRFGKVSSADEKFVQKLNDALGSNLATSDHDIEGATFTIGLSLSY